MRVLLGMMMAAALGAPAEAGAVATARLMDLDRNVVGRASFVAGGHAVVIEIDAKGLPPGPHAVLIHASAACDPATQFTSAGPIFSFEPDRPHGYLAKGGPRAGDLPSQFAAADGTLRASFATTAFSLGNGSRSVFDKDGASIIIHAKGDDHLSQPDGHAGARLVCGTIVRTVAPGPRKRSARKN